jgi:CelD/BcsL family acetyltransferase involved in cellulose biosynthesis
MTNLRSSIAEDPAELESLWREWDALAVAESQPFAAPAWAMAWWRHLRPADARLRIILVHEGEALVGVLPLFSSGRRWMQLAHNLPGAEPLARRGAEEGVAAQAAERLAAVDPRPATIELELRRRSPNWAALLADAWPHGRGPTTRVTREEPIPRVEIDAGYDAWFDSRSSKFRGEARNKRNRVQKAGGSFRYATAETLERDVEAFLALHRSRQAGQGGTNLTDDGIARMLVEAGGDLLDEGRLRLLCLDLDAETIAVRVLVRAGDEVGMWNSGFDEAHSKLSPSVQSMLRAIADAADGRDHLGVSLGPGGQSYKYRLANADDALVTQVLLIPGRGYAAARLRLAAQQARGGLGRRLPQNVKQRIRRVARSTRR